MLQIEIIPPSNVAQYALVGAAMLSAVAAWGGVLVQSINSGKQLRSQRSSLERQLESGANIAAMQIEAASKNASRQSRASVVSASRQRWIDALREDISEFLSLEESRQLAKARASAGPVKIFEAVDEKSLLRLIRRIQLRLNPQEDDHNKLLEIMVEILKDKSGSTKLSSDIIHQSHAIFKIEWNRIKRESAGIE